MMFSAMVNDLVMDATMQTHYEVQKLNALCDICHTRYVHLDHAAYSILRALKVLLLLQKL